MSNIRKLEQGQTLRTWRDIFNEMVDKVLSVAAIATEQQFNNKDTTTASSPAQVHDLVENTAADTLVSANTQTETALNTAKAYTDTQTETALNTAKAYTDSNSITPTLENIELTNTTNSLNVGTYTITINSNTVFLLPSPVANKYNQIKVLIKLNSVVSINWGTDIFFNGNFPDVSEIGNYHAYWDYNPLSQKWVCGVMKEEFSE